MSTLFSSLSKESQDSIKKRAMNVFRKNKTAIYKKIKSETQKVAPMDEGLNNPEKWSAENWKWFLDNSFLL